MHVKTKLIVLHRIPYSDSSWIVKAISAEQGIVSLLLKGAKRKESPFRGSLDPLSETEVVLHRSKTDLHIVKEAHLCNWFPSLRQGLVSLAEATVMAEVLLRFAPQGLPLFQEFSLLERQLELLDTKGNSGNTFSQFLLELSQIWGFAFNIGECGRCGCILEKPPVSFEEESGDVFCELCSSRRPTGRREEYLGNLFRLAKNQALLNPELTEMGILHYLKQHLGLPQKEIRSLSWLQEARKLCSLHKKSV